MAGLACYLEQVCPLLEGHRPRVGTKQISCVTSSWAEQMRQLYALYSPLKWHIVANEVAIFGKKETILHIGDSA